MPKSNEGVKQEKNNKTFCVLPWLHTYIGPEGDVFPCCVSWEEKRANRLGWVNQTSLEEMHNSEFMKQLRQDMLVGKRRYDVCANCYKSEDSGFMSLRTASNNDWKHYTEKLVQDTCSDGTVAPELKSWDIRFSNLCNMKCRTCGPLLSSTWGKEEGEAKPYINAFNGMETDPLHNQYDNVEHIYFAGGEPLIMPEHFKTLQTLIDKDRASQISLVYNSNVSKLNYNKHDLLTYWRQFKQVVIGVSIDGVKERGSYIRSPIPWDTIEENLRRLIEFQKESDNFDFFYSPTVSLLNAWHLPDMHRYLYENGLMENIGKIRFNILYSPEYYDMRILPQHIKTDIKARYINHVRWIQENYDFRQYKHQPLTFDIAKEFKNLLYHLDENKDDSPLNWFVKLTNHKDKVRRENFWRTFPEYNSLRSYDT